MPTSKSEFFERLYGLDNLPRDDGKEVSDAELALKQGGKPPRAARAIPEPTRTVSGPLPRPTEPVSVSSRNMSDPPPRKRGRPRATKTATGPPRKKKKELPLQMVPEDQQIFKGLNFFFLPNNDISELRKSRIRKAMEYGAAWVKEWTDGITHIIADKHITHQDIIKHLNIPSIPDNVILVNEIYTTHCVHHLRIVEPSLYEYQLDRGDSSQTGNVASSATSQEPGNRSPPIKRAKRKSIRPPETPPRRVEPSGLNLVRQLPKAPFQQPENLSLPIKPAKRRNIEPPETPPRRVESSGLTLVRQLSKASLHQLLPSAQIVHQMTNDALDEAIREAQDFKHDESMTNYPSDHDTNDEEAGPSLKESKSGTEAKQDSFQCMHKHDGRNRENPNESTIATLQEMSDYYARTKDQWRPIAYRKAIATLRKQDHKIVTAEEAAKLPNIGSRLAQKIEEIAQTNHLRRLDNAKLEDADNILTLFLGIYGVGYAQASRWICLGYRTFEDLLTHAQLTDNQRIGIEHYEDFKTRIPRAEVDEHGHIVSSIAHSIDPQLQVVIMGSYRRGAETCGDIDFMITKPGASVYELRNILLDELIPSLFEQDFLQVGLAVTSKTSGTKWHGASRLPGREGAKWRRVDFLLVPTEEMGAALIYFTGNDIFNRSIRLLASKKGMRLNQHGLWTDVIRGPNRERVNQGTLLEGKNEERIFELLGVPYRPPEHRNC